MDQGPAARPPQSEPEILPPGSDRGPGWQDAPPRFVFIDQRTGRAIPFARPSLGTMLLAGGILALVVAVIIVFLLGAVLVSLPVLGLIFLGLLFGGLLRPRRL